MEVEILKASKMVAVWVTAAEANDSGIQEKLSQIYADCAERKYTPAEFRSGGKSLPEDQRSANPQPPPSGPAGRKGDVTWARQKPFRATECWLVPIPTALRASGNFHVDLIVSSLE